VEAGIGFAPASEANAASSRRRPSCDHAAITTAAVTEQDLVESRRNALDSAESIYPGESQFYGLYLAFEAVEISNPFVHVNRAAPPAPSPRATNDQWRCYDAMAPPWRTSP